MQVHCLVKRGILRLEPDDTAQRRVKVLCCKNARWQVVRWRKAGDVSVAPVPYQNLPRTSSSMVVLGSIIKTHPKINARSTGIPGI